MLMINMAKTKCGRCAQLESDLRKLQADYRRLEQEHKKLLKAYKKLAKCLRQWINFANICYEIIWRTIDRSTTISQQAKKRADAGGLPKVKWVELMSRHKTAWEIMWFVSKLEVDYARGAKPRCGTK